SRASRRPSAVETRTAASVKRGWPVGAEPSSTVQSSRPPRSKTRNFPSRVPTASSPLNASQAGAASSRGAYSSRPRSTIRRIEAISTTERRASAGFRRGGANAREASAATGMAKVKARRRRPKTPPRRSALGGLGAMGPREVQAGQPAVGLPPLRGQAVLLLELRPGLSSLVPLLLALVDPRL